MSDLAWSWLLTVVGVAGIYLVGRKLLVGFLVGLVSEALWIVYAIKTAQYGFIAGSIIYGWVYIASYRRWAGDTNLEAL